MLIFEPDSLKKDVLVVPYLGISIFSFHMVLDFLLLDFLPIYFFES